MVSIKSQNQIILELIDLLKVTLPQADTKVGTVVRDLMIDPPAAQIALLYDELSKSSNLQSLRLVAGSDLDRLAQNYGAVRKTSTKSSGIGLLTFSSLPAIVNVNKGDLITASNGITVAVVNGISINPNAANFYRSVATKYRSDLDFLGITDQYAAEITIQATVPGASGNLSKYSLIRTSINGVSNVTNVFPMSGGADQETDAQFRNRVLAIFSGSNVGTALGYRNLALADSAVLDALVIGPGNVLMTRDGTQVVENSDGTLSIVSEGTGGKVDILILGTRLSSYPESFIYRDASNNNDPTNIKNQFTLGQIAGDENKTLNVRRAENLAKGILPAQPVDDILDVSGSLSGANFLPKSVDEFGRVSGNYELIKDTGSFAGSPFGFDKFAWVSNQISDYQEDRVKGIFNGQDALTFIDVLQIPEAQQNISITNENSTLSNGDRSILQLSHTPATNVTRVFNTNTGERYTITDQNVDSDNSVNINGRISISGNNLPVASDILQVDYTWLYDYDQYIDYDGQNINSNPRIATDVIDWGLSNAVRNELVLFSKSDNTYVGTCANNINSVISCLVFRQSLATVEKVTTGVFINRLSVTLSNLPLNTTDDEISTIDSITLANSNKEVYATAGGDGSFSTEIVVVGIENKINLTIILPTDTQAQEDDLVNVIYNSQDVFTDNATVGSFNLNQLTIPSQNIGTTLSSNNFLLMRVNYIADTNELISTGITNLPMSRLGNGFIGTNTGFLNGVITNLMFRENAVVQQNGSSQFFVDSILSSSEFALDGYNVISVIRLSDFQELWNDDNPGTVTTNDDGNYQLIFSGYNTPAIGEQTLIITLPRDLARSQPIGYSNKIIKKEFETVQYDFAAERFFVNIHLFTMAAAQEFSIFDPLLNQIIASGNDGLITQNSTQITYGQIYSAGTDFNSIENITAKKIRISNSNFVNNNGLFDIIDFIPSSNTIIFGNAIANIDDHQISLVRILDGQDYWNDSGSIDFINNRLYLSTDTTSISSGDKVVVIYYQYDNARIGPTRVSINISDQTNVFGTLTINGNTIYKAIDIIFNADGGTLQQNIVSALRTALNLSSSEDIDDDISLVRVAKLERVEMVTSTEVLRVINDYDIDGTRILNNYLFPLAMDNDATLDKYSFILPSTTNNNDNIPSSQDVLRITFYYQKINDTENIGFTRNGTNYTNKIFSHINNIFASSGFGSSQSTRLLFSPMNQPLTGTRYTATYDYLAPKQNERIVINYNYNKLIVDTTFTIEANRPINADVLVKAASQFKVDLTMNIVISTNFLDSANIVQQNTIDSLIAAINSNVLGGILDASDLIAVAQAVEGVDRSRVIYFNRADELGSKLSLTAQNNEYFVANDIIVNIENR